MRTLIALACVAALSGCIVIATPSDNGRDYQVHTPFSGQAVDGNGIPARDTRAVASLTGLDVGGSMIVEVRVGGAPSLVVEGDSNLLPYVKTETRGSVLHIEAERRLRSTTPLKVTYTVPQLTHLHSGGSGHVTVRDLKGEPLSVRLGGSGVARLSGNVAEFDAKVSGSGKIEAGELRARSADVVVSGSGGVVLGEVRGDNARIQISGSGTVHTSGAVRSLNVRVSGSGSADLAGLTSEQGDLSSSGSGGISATVRQSVFASTSGSGPIRVYGQPAQRNTSGRGVQML
jgi:Putative auto-transporter adhesin, head GIN domain